MKRLIVIAPLLVFAAMVGVFLDSLLSERSVGEVRSTFIGKPAPALDLPILELPALDVAALDVSAADADPLGGTQADAPNASRSSAAEAARVRLPEGQVVVVNFFASWCVPCRAEHASLMRLQREIDGALIIGVAYKDTSENALRFLSELGDPFDVRASDLNGRAGIDWGVTGVPETYIVSKDGTVTYRHFGPIVGDNLEMKIYPQLARLGVAVPAKGAADNVRGEAGLLGQADVSGQGF